MMGTPLVEPAGLPGRDSGPGDGAEVVDFARLDELTACDAVPFAPALSSDAPLATLDRAQAAARACGVPLPGPLAP